MYRFEMSLLCPVYVLCKTKPLKIVEVSNISMYLQTVRGKLLNKKKIEHTQNVYVTCIYSRQQHVINTNY